MDGRGRGKSAAKVILTQGILPLWLDCPPVSKCARHTPLISFKAIFPFDCNAPLVLCTKKYLFLLFENVELFCFFTPPTSLLALPSFATPAVSQTERRNVRLDGCSSGNVPFQSAFAPEISSLIPLRPIPAKTGIWWEGNVAAWWGGSEGGVQLVC